jgi:hypothetical protein
MENSLRAVPCRALRAVTLKKLEIILNEEQGILESTKRMVPRDWLDLVVMTRFWRIVRRLEAGKDHIHVYNLLLLLFYGELHTKKEEKPSFLYNGRPPRPPFQSRLPL